MQGKEKGRAWKWAGQGNRQGTEVYRARKQAEGRGNRQDKEKVKEVGRARKQAECRAKKASGDEIGRAQK